MNPPSNHRRPVSDAQADAHAGAQPSAQSSTQPTAQPGAHSGPPSGAVFGAPRIARRGEQPFALALSLVVPVYDEEDNLVRLHEEIRRVFDGRSDWELILVDDGSRDRSRSIIRELAAKDARVRGLFFRKNSGQSAAITAGFRRARGAVVATLDADLQNDPRDLPDMLKRLDESGADAVVGYRVNRRDTFVRRISSKIANRVRNSLSGDSIRDTGCSLKVFGNRAINTIPMFDGMHRFLPTLLRFHGFEVLEHPVNHRPRTAGVSKYGIGNRAFKALRDLMVVRWMRTRILRPVVEESVGGPATGKDE